MAAKAKNDEQGAPSRREEILAVAAKVIAERGIKQATVRDIGEAAGILSGSLYYHFESKDQIVLELLLPAVEGIYESARSICEANEGLETLRKLLRDAVLNTAANPHRSIILRNEARIFAELPLLAPVNEYRSNIVGLWCDAIAQGVDAGEIRCSVNPDIVARAMLDGTLGASRWFDGLREVEPEVVADALIDFYIGGLGMR